jgi:hypothetical protein
MFQYWGHVVGSWLRHYATSRKVAGPIPDEAIRFFSLGVILPVLGRAVAQAVSRWLPTAAARVRVRAACGVCGGQSVIGAGFFRVLRFPLPIIPPISPSS